MEIYNSVDAMNREIESSVNGFAVPTLTKKQTDSILQNIPSIIKKKTKKEQVAEIQRYVNAAPICDRIRVMSLVRPELENATTKSAGLESVGNKLKAFEQSMLDIDKSFDSSIHGQKHAKNQLKKIICQWITGEQKGHCFGFEGAPGIGKTSLAKYGLSQCLKDENGTPRPFTFIALGGSCNGSTLEGHGYTYVNSIWGTIVQALMDAKCMNPVFYFDEFDKISKEHGSEIIGILTHLMDYTQNDSFQDRFFSGIPLNVSKALFILSYNDPEHIDGVLLDRIHRVKFENLTLNEKVVIARDYVIPRITADMGLENSVVISNEMLTEIIISYTAEPGVRKMNEILFDLYGELNIELIQRSVVSREIPIVLTADLIDKYLSKYHKVVGHKIHATPQVGVINGLYANARGGGGIIQIEASLYPATSFMEMKLTGMQGDVMQESMHVAKTLAWSLCSKETQDRLALSKNVGLHIHCPEGATHKDGPSAGTAETTVIYSVLNDIPIINTIAITGEIDLRGNVTAIGGLANKIAGGIRAGVKTFLFPKENAKDYEEYKAKQTSTDDTITFIQVSHIDEVFKHVFCRGVP
jgi:ATP-dependent Lon protease